MCSLHHWNAVAISSAPVLTLLTWCTLQKCARVVMAFLFGGIKYMYVYVCIYICVCVCVCECVCERECVCLCVCVCVYLYTYMYIHMYIYACIHLHIYIHGPHTNASYTTCVCTCTHTQAWHTLQRIQCHIIIHTMSHHHTTDILILKHARAHAQTIQKTRALAVMVLRI